MRPLGLEPRFAGSLELSRPRPSWVQRQDSSPCQTHQERQVRTPKIHRLMQCDVPASDSAGGWGWEGDSGPFLLS